MIRLANSDQTVQLVLFLSIFNTSYICLKIRCDGKSEKFCKIFEELNKASCINCAPFSQAQATGNKRKCKTGQKVELPGFERESQH